MREGAVEALAHRALVCRSSVLGPLTRSSFLGYPQAESSYEVLTDYPLGEVITRYSLVRRSFKTPCQRDILAFFGTD